MTCLKFVHLWLQAKGALVTDDWEQGWWFPGLLQCGRVFATGFSVVLILLVEIRVTKVEIFDGKIAAGSIRGERKSRRHVDAFSSPSEIGDIGMLESRVSIALDERAFR